MHEYKVGLHILQRTTTLAEQSRSVPDNSHYTKVAEQSSQRISEIYQPVTRGSKRR